MTIVFLFQIQTTQSLEFVWLRRCCYVKRELCWTDLSGTVDVSEHQMWNFVLTFRMILTFFLLWNTVVLTKVREIYGQVLPFNCIVTCTLLLWTRWLGLENVVTIPCILRLSERWCNFPGCAELLDFLHLGDLNWLVVYDLNSLIYLRLNGKKKLNRLCCKVLSWSVLNASLNTFSMEILGCFLRVTF